VACFFAETFSKNCADAKNKDVVPGKNSYSRVRSFCQALVESRAKVPSNFFLKSDVLFSGSFPQTNLLQS
jgi:hypothetical protein